MTTIMLNNVPVGSAEAKVSVQDRGFRYGDGVFETIAVHEGVPYQFDWHMERMKRSLAAVRIAADTSLLREPCRKLLSMNGVKDGLLRLQITRGPGSRGYLPTPAEPTVVIETLPSPVLPAKPVTLWLSGSERISAKALPAHAKLCQGLNATLARIEADEHGCFDALQLNAAGEITETSSANIFWQRGAKIYTPSAECGICPAACAPR